MNIMTKRGSEDNIVTYEHYCDTKADLENIPQDQISLGSVAIVLKDEDDSMGIYLANSNKEWISFSTGGGGNGGESSTDGDDSGGGDFAGLIDGTITQAHDSTVTSIRMGAFAGCSMLSDIDFPNVEIIKDNAFAGYVSSMFDPVTSSEYIIDARVPIVSAVFPKCKTIGNFAFSNCYQLSQISFPECTTIGYGAFQFCPIKEAVFPKCVRLTSAPFFSDTTPLLEVAVFPALSELGEYRFNACANLKTFVLKDCTYIASNAFVSCTSLESLYVLGSSVATLSTDNAYFSPLGSTKIPTDGYIYVPASLVNSYKEARAWSNYSSRFEGLTDEEIAEILGE